MRLLIPSLLLCLLLSACMGGPAPREHYLRLTAPTPLRAQAMDNQRVRLGIKRLDVLPGLERTSVMIARDRVMSPSNTWYWEGTPDELVSLALVDGLTRSDAYLPVWPFKPRMTHQGTLTGRVLRFEVQEADSTFVLAYHLDLWGKNGKEWRAGRTFEAAHAIPAMRPHDVAQVASQCLAESVREVVAWLDGLTLATP